MSVHQGKSRPLKFDRVETHTCNSYCFKTERRSNYERHTITKKHLQNVALSAESACGPTDYNETCNPIITNEETNLTDDKYVELDSEFPGTSARFSDFDANEDHDEDRVLLDHDADDDSEFETRTARPSETEWFPYESRLHFLLSVLRSSKMHKVSDEVMVFFLFILKECGVTDVPSLANIKKFWSETLNIDEMLQMNEDKDGNLSCMVKPTSLLKLCLANPEIASKVVRCFIQMKKSMLVQIDSIKHVNISSATGFSERIAREPDVYVPMSRLSKEKVLKRTSLWKNKPVVKLPVNIFIDDLSAKISRRWAPLHASQMQLAGLPLSDKHKHRNTLFLTASDTVSMLDLISPVCEDIKQCKDSGIDTYDAHLNTLVTLTTDISLLVTDYNMTSLACNHMGPSANKFCPKCFADKSDPCAKWEPRKADITQRTLNSLKINPNKTLSKETGVKYYENCLWQHIDPHRKSAGDSIKEYGQNRKILSFMGFSEDHIQENKAGQLKIMVCQANKKPKNQKDTWTEVQTLQGIISCNGNISVLNDPGLKIIHYMSCVTQDEEEASPGSFVLYKYEDKIKIGQIQKIAQIKAKRNTYNIVEIRNGEEVNDRNPQKYQYIKLHDRYDFVPSDKIISVVHMLHDCRGGFCRLAEGRVCKRMEQRDVFVTKKFLKHNSSHLTYIINMFHMTHSLDKFIFE